MATSLYSTSLRLALPTTGDLFGTWGTEINNSITNMVDQAVAGRAVVSMTSDANYTLTALNGTSDEARCAVLKITSTLSLTAQRNVVCPVVPKLYIVENATTGGQAIQIIGATGTGVVVPSGRTYRVRCDGTNVILADGDSINGLGGAAFPSYTFSGDTNTGMWSPGADQIAWSTGGVQHGTIDSSGRWGFGASALSNAWKYTVVSATSTSVSEYGDYTVLSSSNTSGAVAKIAFAGVARAVTGFAGTGSIVGVQGVGDLTNAVTVATLYGVQGVLSTAAAGTLTTGAAFTYAASNGGSAAITNLVGYLAPDMSATATLIAGYYGVVTTGTGKWNLYIPGTARSYHAGRLMVGTATENTSGAKLQTSDGITFPATAVASSDANTLDDYEEGTWTPTDGSGAGLSLAGSSAVYTKIGREVHISAAIVYPVTASGAQALINGLPFTVPGSYATGGGIVMFLGGALNAWAYLTNGTTNVEFYKQGTTTKVLNSELSGLLITIKTTYPV